MQDVAKRPGEREWSSTPQSQTEHERRHDRARLRPPDQPALTETLPPLSTGRQRRRREQVELRKRVADAGGHPDQRFGFWDGWDAIKHRHARAHGPKTLVSRLLICQLSAAWERTRLAGADDVRQGGGVQELAHVGPATARRWLSAPPSFIIYLERSGFGGGHYRLTPRQGPG